MNKNCKKCGLKLPENHRKLYCVGPKHACWCSDSLNKWRLDNGIITLDDLRISFFRTLGTIPSPTQTIK